MDPEQEERITAAVESIAGSFDRISRNLEGLYALAEIGLKRALPDRSPQRPAVIHKIQSEQEKVDEAQQQAESKSTDDWLREFGEDFIGEREREFLLEQAEQAKIVSERQGKASESGAQETRSEPGGPGPVSGDQPYTQKGSRRPARVDKRDAPRG